MATEDGGGESATFKDSATGKFFLSVSEKENSLTFLTFWCKPRLVVAAFQLEAFWQLLFSQC